LAVLFVTGAPFVRIERVRKPPEDRMPGEARLLARFGANVRRERVNAKLSQDELADAAGVSQSAISMTELGETAPTLVLVYRLARALDVDPANLQRGLRLPPKRP
jgi:DNA-binding XRE family transcriptional regulator